MYHLTGNIRYFFPVPQKCPGLIRIWPNRNYLASLILIRNSGLRTRTHATFLGPVKWHSPHGSMSFHGAQKKVEISRAQLSTVWATPHLYVMILMQANSLLCQVGGVCALEITARCHFTGPKKVSISRVQPPPIYPRSGFARIINITYGAVSNRKLLRT